VACLRAWAAEWVAAWAAWTTKPNSYSLTKALNTSRARKGPAVLRFRQPVLRTSRDQIGSFIQRAKQGESIRTSLAMNGSHPAVSNLLL
jgi:hypothetical protein